jgi:threonine/homoserine/homoserine lactone efflux protein
VIEYLLLGSGFAVAAALQPGPTQAYLLSRTAAIGWKRTLPASLAPVLSDGPVAFIALVVLSRLPDAFQDVLRLAGGLLLVWLAVSAYREARSAEIGVDGSGPRSLFEATLVNLLNPNPYLGWALVLGPSTLAAWNESRILAFVLVGSFYVTMVATLAAMIVLLGATGLLSERRRRALVLVSAVLLLGLGVYLLAMSAWRLGGFGG